MIGFLKPGGFEVGARLSLGGSIRERPNQNAEHAVLGGGSEHRVEALFGQRFGDDLGIRPRGRHHLPVLSGGLAGHRSSHGAGAALHALETAWI